ncbi:Eco57I restriction-modification methylase domain-containing protein [Lactobacillus gallinarum]|uniref:Eco57I restriction-modification methylase domain-containing protein n=1 Tax=Lactobacillus gallinarum TaxID=52242 RepID=UPI0025A373AF|nr:Eco57I restriction-modification methylase domain-containing protein [Lactobacillus gallinarum]MDM8281835.1 Eco57I restriction-modification methylase domain-containing protein [Lactobacillus gallinarum]
MTDEEKHKKFDVIIGNPPYQEETHGKKTKNGQKRVKSIFQLFQLQAESITNDIVSLIYPGGRWIHQSGKGMAKFGLDQINDPHLQELTFYPNSDDVFQNVAIGDGLSVVVKNMHKTVPGFKYIYIKGNKVQSLDLKNPGKQMMPLDPDDLSRTTLISDFVEKYHLKYLHESVLSQKLFGIESSFVEDNPDKVKPFNSKFDTNKYIKLYANDKAGKSGRATWFLANKNIVTKNKKYLSEWQVVVSSANAGGQKRDNQLSIMDNHTVFGRARVALKSFKTEQEAINFKKYVSSYIIRYAFLMTDEALTSLAKWVPDVLDYSSNNKLINFDDDIDYQLCKLIGFNDNDFNYIKNRVDTFRKD